jgi:perosamine synthetase
VMLPHEQLEKDFGRWIGRKNMVACSSGTAALHLALETLKLPLGSTVITGEFNMIAVPRAITLAGHIPRFVDCNDKLLIEPDYPVIPRPKAVIPVHIYGRKCNMGWITDHARNNGLAVIEDMAEAHGIEPHIDSDAACWSFYKNKIVAGQEGGMVYFKHAKHMKLAKQLRCLGFTDAHDFDHIPRGMNYRMSDIHAELISLNLASVRFNQEKRALLVDWYNTELSREWMMPPRDANWVYDLHLPGVDTVRVVDRLNSNGIAARLAFKCMSQQEEYAGQYKHLNAYQWSREIIYLPLNVDIDRRQVIKSCDKLKEVVRDLSL